MTQAARPNVPLLRAIAALTVVVGAFATLLLLVAQPAVAQTASVPKIDPQFVGWAFVAAALSTALAAVGAGYAVARVGSAAIGAIAEKPELFGRVLVLVGLAEGIAIYGLIVSILILNRIG
jgi:V/A-type H+/Na+-transporting ATPase subunit K